MITKFTIAVFSSGLILGLLVMFLIPSNEEINIETEIRLHDIEQEKALLEKKNNQLQFKINLFENEVLKNDSIIDNSTTEQLDSLFINYFAR